MILSVYILVGELRACAELLRKVSLTCVLSATACMTAIVAAATSRVILVSAVQRQCSLPPDIYCFVKMRRRQATPDYLLTQLNKSRFQMMEKYADGDVSQKACAPKLTKYAAAGFDVADCARRSWSSC